MNLVDVHCHLNHAGFKADLDAVLERAKKAGVKSIIVSGVNPPGNREVLQLAEKFSLIQASLGMYPIEILGLGSDGFGLPVYKRKIDLEQEFVFVEQNKNKIIAIGEIGMDFNWAKKEETLNEQAENFRKILHFALKLRKPVVIHSRKAEQECLEVLKEEIKNKEIPVVLHCFSGRKSLVREAAALGYFFSIPPNILRSGSFQDLVKIVDISQLLTETDAPWLSPFPGKRNEPANVLETVKKIAEIKKIFVEEAAGIIWKNYENVFLKHS